MSTSFWNAVSVVSGILLILAGLYYIIGILRARRAGLRVPTQRGWLMFGVGYVVYGVSVLLLPMWDSPWAGHAKAIGVLTAGVFVCTGAVWLRRERDKIKGT